MKVKELYSKKTKSLYPSDTKFLVGVVILYHVLEYIIVQKGQMSEIDKIVKKVGIDFIHILAKRSVSTLLPESSVSNLLAKITKKSGIELIGKWSKPRQKRNP